MKKLLAVLLAAVLSLSAAGCTGNTPADTAPQNATLTEAPSTPEPTEAVPTEAATEESEPTEATEATEPTELPTQPEETQPPVHTHTFSNATCTVPAKCVCGVTTGSALGHSWQSATCYNPQSCTRCFATQGSALGHDWQEATCQSPKACPRCGKTEGDPLPHNYENGECSSCGDSQYADISLIDGKAYYAWVLGSYDWEPGSKKFSHYTILYSSSLSSYKGNEHIEREIEDWDIEDGDNIYGNSGGYDNTYWLEQKDYPDYYFTYEEEYYAAMWGGGGFISKAEIVDNRLVFPEWGEFALQKDGYLVVTERYHEYSECPPVGTLFSTDWKDYPPGATPLKNTEAEETPTAEE